MRLNKRLRNFGFQLRYGGIKWLANAILNRLFKPKVLMNESVSAALNGRCGLEIGGPSSVFSATKTIPVYAYAARIDNVNFAIQTRWEHDLRDGGDFCFNPEKPCGTQWIREANALLGIADRSYDFVLSSHCLEHIADPLSALVEWNRIVKPGGHLLVIVPDSVGTFDHQRPVTKIEHLLDDQRRHVGEDDLTHLDEILAFHDLRRDPNAGTLIQFRERALRNAENRCLHHHVFDLDLLTKALIATGWEVLATEKVRPVHLVALACKK